MQLLKELEDALLRIRAAKQEGVVAFLKILKTEEFFPKGQKEVLFVEVEMDKVPKIKQALKRMTIPYMGDK
jgi:hypothetical protein